MEEHGLRQTDDLSELLNKAKEEKDEEDSSQYINILGSEQVCDPLFKYLRHRAMFELKNLEKSKNPEGVLKKLLQHTIYKTLEESKKYTGMPDRFGLRIISKLLKNGEFCGNFEPINAKTLDSIMNCFNKISHMSKEDSIIGAPFTVEVTTICFDSLCKEVGQRKAPIMPAS